MANKHARSALDLFRPEARASIAGQGHPLMSVPVSWEILSALILAALIGAGIYISVVTVPRQEQARGRLLSAAGEVRIMAPQPGVIQSLEYRNGDTVRAGATLAQIATDRRDQSGAGRAEIRQAHIEKQSAWLKDRRRAVESQWTAQKASLDQDMDARRRQLDRLNGQINTIEKRAVLARDRRDAGARLVEKGVLAVDAQRDREAAAIDNELRLLELLDRIQGEQDRLKSLRYAIDNQRSQYEKEVAEIEGQLVALTGEQALLGIERAYTVIAPISGRITAQDIHLGDAVDGQRPLMVIIPENEGLTAELYLSPRSAGFVERGKRVQLRLDGFPYQKFGTVEGTIENISLTSLVAREVNFPVGEEPVVYRATVRIDEVAGVRNIRLQPGMTVTAQIILEERPILEWLFEPLIATYRAN
jgi:membrane fusion protein